MAACMSSTSLPTAIRYAATTLDLFIDAIRLRPRTRSSVRGHSTNCNAGHAAPTDGEVPASDLLSRFSGIMKLFPNRRRAFFPEPGAKPLESDPFHYNLLMKAFSRAGRPDEVLRLFREMKESKCDPNVLCYTTVIDALVASNRSEEAEKVFEEMIDSGVTPDAASFTVLVKFYSFYLRRFDSACEIIRWMVRSGCDPDVVTYSTLIAGLCRAGMVEEAWCVLDQMLQGNCSPNAHSYAPFLQAYCSQGKIEAAIRLMESMRSIGCPPDSVAYNILMNGFCKHGCFNEAAHLLENCASDGWEPDAVTYNTYISGLCKVGRAEDAFEQLEIMLQKKLCPTVVTLNIVLDSICRESTVWDGNHNLERSLELGLEVDVVSYNTIISRLCEIGKLSWVLKLVTDMIKKGISPSTETFNIMIRSLCKAGKFRKAKCIFTSKGFVADIITCNILIHEFYMAGKIVELQNLLSGVDMDKIRPDSITYNTIIDCLCKKGKFLEAIDYLRSVEDGFPSEAVAHLAYWLVRGRKIGELLSLFEEMLSQGLVLDGQAFNHLIIAFCKNGSCQSREIYKVCLVLDKMLGVV
ncbi:hypothetical protein BHE74_00044553 [Ensete ventricosum]|nr:hypothetical protein BHE74_00044553 [Ensete ventricosum]